MKSFDIEGASHDDHIFRTIIKNRSFYEEPLLRYMLSCMNFSRKKNTLTIDVGANIGNHSIFMRSFLSDFLIAIEPNPKVLPLLQRNLSKNIDNYTIFDYAVGEAECVATIDIPDDVKNNVGMAKVSFDGSGEKINVKTLDSIFDQWKKTQNKSHTISAIKIDVEGMELSVLKGAKIIIANHKPDIFAEAATTEEYKKLNNYLTELGYRKLSKWGATPVYHFAYKPTLLQIAATKGAEIFQKIRRLKLGLSRQLSRN